MIKDENWAARSIVVDLVIGLLLGVLLWCGVGEVATKQYKLIYVFLDGNERSLLIYGAWGILATLLATNVSIVRFLKIPKFSQIDDLYGGSTIRFTARVVSLSVTLISINVFLFAFFFSLWTHSAVNDLKTEARLCRIETWDSTNENELIYYNRCMQLKATDFWPQDKTKPKRSN